jgi:hypothetical protein
MKLSASAENVSRKAENKLVEKNGACQRWYEGI